MMADAPSTGSTGAGGPSGAGHNHQKTIPAGTTTSTPPAHPHQVPNPNYTPGPTQATSAQATWDRSKHAAAIQDAYGALRTTAVDHLPSLGRQFELLARRPIGG